MNIQNSNLSANGLSFSGHGKSLNKKGEIQHNFYYLYDSTKYKCEVELYNIDDDERGNIDIMEDDGPAYSFDLPRAGKNITIPKDIYTDKYLGFAYRFKLTEIDKNGNPVKDENGQNKVSYAFDNGDVIGISDRDNTNNKYNIILSNRAVINKNGPMQLIMPDEYYPGIEKTKDKNGKQILTVNDGLRSKALASVRTHANKLGGTFDGIMYRLPEIKKEGISRIVGMPYTKDTVSSHLYWTENAYQIAPTLGTEEDFKELQRKLFSNGINWIADAALVNEGLGGVHLNAILRKGQESYAENMFRGFEQKALGILPAKNDDKNDVTIEHTKMKIMNAPFVVNSAKIQQNPDYNKNKPTYIQFYDDRLASKKQINSDLPSDMKTYENKNTDNIYDITKHDDAVYPFSLEVDPDALLRNTERLFKDDSKKFESSRSVPYDAISDITDFANFKVVEKGSSGGLELWDGNVDIAKLNFFVNPSDYGTLSDEQMNAFERGTLAVKDYAINSGRYWTQLTADTQLEFIASELSNGAVDVDGYYDSIKKLVKSGVFPESAKSIDKEIIKNVLDGSYKLRKLETADTRSELNPEIKEYNGEELKKNDYNVNDYILKKALDTPLETLPIATNLMSILTSPYIEQKPINHDELGISKYDLTRIRQDNPDEKYDKTTSQMTNIYENDIAVIINSVVRDIEGITDENGLVTDYGRYVLSEITPDLTRYILVKALDKDANIEISDDGHFDFSKTDEENITMQSLGIKYNSGMTEEEEAQVVINKISSGIDKISINDIQDLQQKIQERFKDRTLNDYKVAEMIHDRTESGLGWRIDAAKDVASIDAVRSGSDTMENAWNNVIDFWKIYNQTILKENPHSYTTAEITDLSDFFGRNDDDKYMHAADAEKKFLEQTGITSVANYNYFFSLLPELFTNNKFEDGSSISDASSENSNQITRKLTKGWVWYDKAAAKGDDNPGFLFQSPEDGVINSYTFVGNHDKPRVLHGLALDMGLFHGGLQSVEHRKIADNVLQSTNVNYDELDSKAIAMGDRINTAINAVITDEDIKAGLKTAVSHLAQGNHKGKHFASEAFGTRPFEIAIKTVFDEAEYNGLSIKNRDELEAKILQSIIEPAFDKYLSIYKMLVLLPGSPTDFAGDRLGATGYESKAKNYHQQNRNTIHWEYLKDENKDKYNFIQDFYKEMNEISNLRNRKELSALNNGATVTLPVAVQNADKKLVASEKIQSMLRYNDEGSVVLSIQNNIGANTTNTMPRTNETFETSVSEKQMYNRIIFNTPDDLIAGFDYGNQVKTDNAKNGLKHGIKEGMKFKNAKDGDNSTYKVDKMVFDGKEYYCLRRFDANAREIPITINKDDRNSLVLYSEDGPKIDK